MINIYKYVPLKEQHILGDRVMFVLNFIFLCIVGTIGFIALVLYFGLGLFVLELIYWLIIGEFIILDKLKDT